LKFERADRNGRHGTDGRAKGVPKFKRFQRSKVQEVPAFQSSRGSSVPAFQRYNVPALQRFNERNEKRKELQRKKGDIADGR
jgi:hypothetical protein